MMRHLPAALLGIAALALSACATPVPPVEVTRFHIIAVAGWAPGTLYVVDPRTLADTTGRTSGSQQWLEWDRDRTARPRPLRLQRHSPARGAPTSQAEPNGRSGEERGRRRGRAERQ